MVIWQRDPVSTGAKIASVMITLPVAVSGDDIIDLELLADFLDAKVEGVGLELFAGHICDDCSGEAHESSGLVLGGVAPSIALLATSRTIGIASCIKVSIALREKSKGLVGTHDRGCDRASSRDR